MRMINSSNLAQTNAFLSFLCDVDESLLDETECPLVVDAKITPMAFLHLIDARCRAGTHTSTLPLASGRA